MSAEAAGGMACSLTVGKEMALSPRRKYDVSSTMSFRVLLVDKQSVEPSW